MLLKTTPVLILPVFLVFGFSSCVTPEKPAVPPAEVPGTFSESGKAPLPDQWWRSFGDPALNRQVEQALDGNFSLRTVWDRLRQSRAAARQAAAPLYPAVGGAGSASRTREAQRRSGGGGGSEAVTLVQAAPDADLVQVESSSGGNGRSGGWSPTAATIHWGST